MFKRLLIANRGEIACRIIRTCRRLGIETVAVYSDADVRAQHVLLADQAIHIGGAQAAESYLRIDAIDAAARRSGAEAVHPGYGFLAENAELAQALTDAGIVFVGPNLEAIQAMASKAAAKELMTHAGVPLVPGYHGQDQSPDVLSAEAARTGFPLMIKAAAGGGGKGMRIVRGAGGFADALASAQREAASAFGDQRMILERYVETPRHIEFQVFGDQHGNIVHLGERECSAQRRYQKVLEETPSPFLTPERRQVMGAAAVAAAKAVDYLGAGTVEFIVAADGEFFFMEMNTRLQVEHPVTEMVTGLDLVEWQLRVAAGEPLPLPQENIVHRGHSIEVRLYAEDPEQNFLPGSGVLTHLRLPADDGRHVRVDTGVVEGDTVSIFYDPMIAKLIVHDVDRPAALRRLAQALADSDIVGPKSNIAFLETLIQHPAIVQGTIDTGYLDRHLEQFVAADSPMPDTALVAATIAELLAGERRQAAQTQGSADPCSPWAQGDAWRIGHHGKRAISLEYRGERIELGAWGGNGSYRIEHGDQCWQVDNARHDGDWLTFLWRHGDAGSQGQRLRVRASGSHWLVFVDGRRHALREVPFYAWTAADETGSDQVLAPMPGRIVTVKAQAGQAVQADDELLVMEAMKMELVLRAPRAGTLAEVRAQAGEFVEADTVLVKLAPESGD
ncbi:MAG: ATP-grasp domain-containing protein [Xanthomonadales bacterium]|nr:ATP-grasp domain-containing protein [Xanthomonadales bacterium]